MLNNTLEKWEEKNLKDLCEIEIGKTPNRSTPKFWDKELITDNTWLSIADLNNTVNKEVFTSKERVSDIGASNIKIVKQGTLLLSFKLTIGRVAFAGKDLYTNEAIAQLPIKNEKEIDKNYLYYYLQYFNYDELLKGDVKVKGKTLNKEKLKALPVLYPDKSEQQRIVGILDEAFENIEKAKQNTLQNLNNAKELFDNNLYDLFTKNTELWEQDSLHNICEKISAGGDKPEVFSETKTTECNIPIYSNGIKDNGLYGYTNKSTIDKPAITISARGTIGFVCKRLEPYCPIVRLISLIPKDYMDLSFLAYAMSFIIPKNTGTSIPQLTVPNLKNSIVKYPSLEEQQKIVEQLDELQEQTKKLEQIYTQKLKDLDELKQSILQKAFNGEL